MVIGSRYALTPVVGVLTISYYNADSSIEKKYFLPILRKRHVM